MTIGAMDGAVQLGVDAPIDSIPDASADIVDAPADTSSGDATHDASTDSTVDAGLDSTASDGSQDASIPDVSPDTSVTDAGDARIVFAAASSPNGPSKIQIMHADGSGIQVLTGTASALPDNASDQPSFSPDGQTILFSSRAYIVTDSGMVMSTSRALYTMGHDGPGSSALPRTIPVLTSADVNGTPSQFDFSLSPDETQFVLAVYESGSTSTAPSAAIGTTTLAQEGMNSLTSFLPSASCPSWR